MSMQTPHQKGYTLVELLLYITILGLVLSGVTMFFGAFIEARVKNQSIVEVSQQGSLAVDTITQAIRKATSITAPTAGNTSPTSLTLVMPSGAESPTVVDLSGGALRIKEGTGAAIPLTNSKVQVTLVTFSNLTRGGTPGVVRVEFTISRVNPVGKNEYDYQKKFYASAALRKP